MDEEIEQLKSEFYSILQLLRKEMDEMKQEINLLKEKEMIEYNKLLSKYVPLKDKEPSYKRVIDNIEYILDNNILFNELGEIVGKLQGDDIIWI